jgi:serine/threonine protein kinase
MRRLYLKIPPSLQQYFPGGAPVDWRERAFKDATEAGTKLTMLELPANDLGPRAALLGDDFYFEVGLDRSRTDTLFLTRIEPAKAPNRIPHPVKCDVRLWPGGVPPVLDSVSDLLGRALIEAEEPAPAPVVGPTAVPSAALLAMLADVKADVRRAFRPARTESTAVQLLTPLRSLWARHRLDRHIEPSGRQAALLRGVINPPELPDSERHALMALFGFGLLNKLAAAGPGGLDELERVLRSLGDVPDAASRLTVWAALASALPAEELRRELADAREGLASVADDDGRVAAAAAGVVPLLQKAAQRVADASLAAVLEGAHPNASVFGELSRWAARLEFSEEDGATQRPTPVEATEIGPTVPAESALARVVDEWVLRLRGLGPDQVREQAEIMRNLLAHQQAVLNSGTSIESFPAMLASVSAFADATLEWLGELPDPGALVQDREEALAAFLEASELLGEPALELASGLNDVTPRELRDAVALLKDPVGLRAVPAWMWGDPDGRGESPQLPVEMAAALLDGKTRAAVQDFLDKLGRLGQPAAAGWLPPLPPGRPVEEHVTEWFEKAREFLLEVPPEVQKFLRHQGGASPDLNLLLGNAALVNELKKSLGDDRTAQVLARLASLSAHDVATELHGIAAAVEFFNANVGSLDDIGVDALFTRAAKARGGKREASGNDAVDSRRVSIDHNWIDQKGSRASLLAVPKQEGSQLSVIATPLVLEIAQPTTIAVRIDWHVKGALREAWPPEWPEIEPSEAFAIYPQDWRPNPNGPGYLHSFPATFPVRLPRHDTPRSFDVVATVRNADTGELLSEPRTLRWDQIESQSRPLSVEWADATNPDYIRQHPIGPQEKSATVLQRLRSGSSIAVIAPRRFGKSTLAEYLVGESEAQGLVMPPAIWCTEFWSPGGFDYQRLWDRASHSLKALLGAEIGSGRQGVLPGPEAFDHARKVAAERGKNAIVLLFDEAQLFFPSHGGFELSSMLKMLLEKHWARAEKGMVPLLIGFVGLPSLRYRVGTDLKGLLNPIERSTMEEAELRPLIANMARGLQTTREARVRLAGAAGNLFLLRVLLDRLATQLNRDGRTWAAYRDVLHVEENLRRELQQAQPEGETVAAYVRDVLNEAERVEEWRPIPAFPVAVALAQERQAGLSFDAVLEHVTAALNRWCLDVADQHVRPTYDLDTVSEHVRTLQERGVLRGDEFASRLLGAWLLGVGGRIGQGLDEAFRDALLKGAQRRIEIPQGVHRVAGGGEASIVRQQDRAFRIRPVRTEQERHHYQATVRVTQMLKDVIAERKAGSDYIFEPIDIGLSLRNSQEAVQIYRWVEGRDLSDRQGMMSEESVVEIGLKLGRAVFLLHKNNILHRDICPRNVILAEADAESVRPVLIDFGFARIAEGRTSTTLAGEHVAPEVGTQPAYWSKAADVFSLAWTLKWLLVPEGDSELRPMLERALSREPEARPSAERFVTEMEGLAEQLALEQKQEMAWRELQQGLRSEDKHSPWVQPLLRRNRSVLIALQLNFSRDRFDQYRSVADFLNQVTEECPKRNVRFRDIESRLSGGAQLAVSVMRALRNDRVHGVEAKSQETRLLVEQFRAMGLPKQRLMVSSAATQVGQACQFPSLPELVERLLSR